MRFCKNGQGFFILIFGLMTLFREEGSAQTPNHPYPRTAIFQFGTAVTDWYARFDLIDISSESPELARDIKKLNPSAIVLPTRGWTSWNSKGRHRFPDPTRDHWIVPNSKGEAAGVEWETLLIDLTNLCPRFEGQRFNDAFPAFFVSSVDFSVFDGVASDWLWSKPHNISDVDFDRNGVNDYKEHGKAWVNKRWREGVETLLANFRKVMPEEKLILVNSGSFHKYGWETTNGLILEWWSGFHSWDWFIKIYRRWMRKALQPHVLIMDSKIDGGDPFRPDEPKNYYRLMRGMLTATMLGDGYFNFADPKSGHHYHRYYDEFDLNLGYPTSEAQALANGCWVRFFDKGASITNPTGSVQRVFDSDLRGLSGYNGPYYRFHGGQDVSVNNGEPFNSVELWGAVDRNKAVGDGIILVSEPTTVVSDIIIDNLDYGTSPQSKPAQFTGSWQQTDEGDAGYYLIDRARSGWFPHASSDPGNGGATARFVPTIGVAGKYEVFEWHGYLSRTGRASNVPCKITADGGNQTNLTIDQSKNEGQWNSLGVFTFDPGTAGGVEITNDANGTVVADAFKFVFKENTISTADMAPNRPTGVMANEGQ